ncbi:hypothetical protein HWV62_12871 [Athelia sp. TMB]|nr:hypothetical protein HWV62_12871 [Athelia sp. TMB]
MSSTATQILSTCPCISSIELPSFPNSPVPDSRSSHGLSPSEKQHIRSTLLQVRDDLAQLDTAMAQVNTAMVHLNSIRNDITRKQRALHEFSRKNRGRLSLIHSFPPEILAEIFFYFKRNWFDYQSRTAQKPYGRDGLILPTHVCRHWRQVALSTPFLWNHVFVSADLAYAVTTTSKVERAQAWVTRAGDCPLYMYLQCSSAKYEATWNALLQVVLPTSRRWKRAVIVLQTGADFSSIRNKLPLLETLDIRSFNYVAEPTDDFEIMPMLTNLSLTPVGAWVGAHTFPWTQLTTFDGNGHEITVQQSHHLVSKMPNLTSLNVSLLYEPNPSTSITSPLRFPQLESLNLTAGGDGGIDCFLNVLEFPSLRVLTCTFWETNGDSDYRWGDADGEDSEADTDFVFSWVVSLISLIDRSSCSIEYLNLTVESMYTSIHSLLQATPHLKALNIEWLQHGSRWRCRKVIQSLTVPSAGEYGTLVPNLVSLRLQYESDFQMDAFVTMIDSRWRLSDCMAGVPPTRIRSVRLRDVRDSKILDAKSRRLLREMGTEGLKQA